METIQSGMRLTPGRLNPVRCIVTRSAAQSVNSGGSGSAISFSAETLDTNGMWSSGTTLIIMKNGSYDLNASAIFASGGTGVRAINIQKNGVTIAEQKRSNTNQSDPISVSTADLLVVNDQITVFAFHTQGSALNVTSTILSVVQTGGS